MNLLKSKSFLLGIAVLGGTLTTVDNCKISFVHYKNNHDKIIIIAHGFYNSKDAVLLRRLAKALLKDYDVFMFDFRGHGKSSCLFSWTSKEVLDLKAVLDYLEAKYKKIGIIAFSLGASVSLNLLAEDNRVDSLVCVSAASSFDKIDYQFWKLDLQNDLIYTLFSPEGRKGKGVRIGVWWQAKQSPIDNVDKIKASVLYLHGDRDWVIRSWHSEVLYSKTNSNKKLVIFKDGPHAEYLLKTHKSEFIKEVKDWLKSSLN